MSELRILISGDYWHDDFQAIIASFPVSITLSPLNRLPSITEQTFDLIVIAQARPDQISRDLVDQLQQRHPTTPLVSLLGSWCEGGARSDTPWPGVRRIYWHQWNGRFDQFSRQLAADGLSLWNQPPTATDADDAMNGPELTDAGNESLIVISAEDQTQFEYLRDTVEAFGWQACWAERATLDPSTAAMVSAACLDGNSVTESLIARVHWLQTKLPDTPLTLTLNFPRAQDFECAAAVGIHDIVSKPFQPVDLKHAIENAMARAKNSKRGQTVIPAPHLVQSFHKVT